MDKTFNPVAFIKDLSEELVAAFDRVGRATTPTLVGTAREKEVRKHLEALLPSFVGVGTGCVIDTNLKTSKQCDIVLYEKDFCPVFSVGDTFECGYYPCEGVIAVGEIKSSLNSKCLSDAFANIDSVKALRRHTTNPLIWKSYGSKLCAHGTDSESFSQEQKYSDQIYGFILCGSVELTIDTFMEKYVEECNIRPDYHLPNLTVSLHDGVFSFVKEHSLWPERKGCEMIVHVRNHHFGFLLRKLFELIQTGRTVTVPTNNYILDQDARYDTGRCMSIDSTK